jgi:hypothetical protein
MYLPSVDAILIEQTIDNLWEDGAEFNRDIKSGVHGEVGTVERGKAVMELNNSARYLAYLDEIRLSLKYS